jgi:SAM-dependent methyltransferase
MTERSYIRVPAPSRFTAMQKIAVGAAGILLSPVYWFLASKRGAPGMTFRAKCAKLGVRLFFSRRNVMPMKFIYLNLFGPMDSTRYFEFDILGGALSRMTIKEYLDVSSPRLFPAILVDENPSVRAHMINPDARDLHVSRMLIQSMGIQERCRLHDCLISNAPFEPEKFDLITCISVIEHIPDDRCAVEKMWSLLKPQGRLWITVPCSAKSSEQYIDRNEYGILSPAENGYFFWQRFYDSEKLKDRIFSLTGPPSRQAVYGEKIPESFQKNAARKRADRYYPLWKEPYMMACEYRRYESIEELPGEGVIAMEFIKS